MRKRIFLPALVAMTAFFTVAAMSVAFGAELITAEVAGTSNDVTVTQGASSPFNITLTASGAISCAITSGSPSTAKVDTSFAVSSAGSVSSTTPSSAYAFFSDGVSVGGSNCGVTWTGAPTGYSVPASVTAAATTPVGTYTIALGSDAGTTVETNPTASGGKLGDTTATNITVHVVAPTCTGPTVTTDPIDATVTYGADASFSATASGSPAPSLQWQKDAGSGFANMSGETSSPLTIADPTVAMSGNKYRAVFTSTCGTATSNAATLTVAKADATFSINPYEVDFDGAEHTATGTATGANGEDLSSLLDFSGTAHTNAGTYSSDTWSFAGNANHNSGGGTITDVIDKVAASCDIVGWTGKYDGDPHGATGSCAGDGTLDLGASYTNVPGGNAHWTYTGATNYENTAGDVTIDISKADATIDVDGYSGIYDAAAHGATGSATGVGGVDLSGSLDLGATFTNVPGGTADWSFSGGTNYNNDSGSVAIVINKANASCTVTGYDVNFDYASHTATGSCVGVVGEPLTGLNLSGTTHTAAGSYTDAWTFTAPNDNYNNTNGNVNDVIRSWWTLRGFYAPVDMNGVVNTVKGGSTVPLKFEMFAGTTELTDVAVIDTFSAKKVSCSTLTGDPLDEIEMVSTGGTSLRYDSTGGQFIQNWQTPKAAGVCYSVTVTTDDGSTIGPAYFKTK
jgi:hypothetical protein